MATAWLLAICLFPAHLAFVAALSPQVNYPLSSQSPPIARIDEPYQFQFAPTTFQPNPEKLQYGLIGNPSWLSLNGKNRTLVGTPNKGDEGTISFTITATMNGGDTAKMESKLLVTDTKGPAMKANISEVLSKAGPLSASDALALLPSSPFAINFPMDTFQPTEKELTYRATLADHTPLPAWIFFDASSLRLSGTTPPLSSSPLIYDLLLIASDDPQYAAASCSFRIVVSNHQFVFKPTHLELDITRGEHFSITLRDNLSLDNKPTTEADIQSASASLPSWMTFNERTLEIAGDVPFGVNSQDVSISVTGKFGDTATQALTLHFNSILFAGEIGTLNIVPGKQFDYQIPQSIFSNPDLDVAVGLGPLDEWLNFDPTTLTISGVIPGDSSEQSLEATLTATSPDGKSRETQNFQFAVLPESILGGDDGNTSNKASDSSDNKHKTGSKGALIAGIVVAALVGATIVAIFACILCRRKRNPKKPARYIGRSPRSPRSPKKTDISRPIIIQEEWETVNDKSLDPDLEKGDGVDTPFQTTPEHPPQIRLNLGPIRKVNHSANSSLGERESKILNSFAESQWGFKDGAELSSHVPHDSMKIPTAMARRESDQSEISKRRRTTQVYRDSKDKPELPVNRRLTGLGHGRHPYSPSQSPRTMSGYRRTMSHNSYSTISTSILSTTPSALPQSLTTRHTTQLTTPMNNRRSIRLVSKAAASTCDSLVERRTMDSRRRSRGSRGRRSIYESLMDLRNIDQRRQSYIRKRASAQSPFFAGSSRVSSSSYKSPPPFVSEDGTPSKPTPSPLSNSISLRTKGNVVAETERELPDTLRIRKPSETPSVEEPARRFPGSLRTGYSSRPSTSRPVTAGSGIMDRGRVYKQYPRPTTAWPVYSSVSSGSRQSVRAHELKSSLNSLTGSKIFEDAEMSESVYSSEEEDIEDYEKRTTVKPGQYSLAPLQLDRRRRSKGNSQRESKEVKRDSKRALKKTSEREPTPYALATEHGGKENNMSTYSLSLTSNTSKAKLTALASRSPERPNTVGATYQRPASRIRRTSDSHKALRPSKRQSQMPLSRQTSNTSRRISRPSSKIGLDKAQSRPQSRHSTQTVSHSRVQSTAYPYFDISTLPSTLKDPSKPSKEEETQPTGRPRADTATSRDMDGNILNYAVNEDPTIEILGTGSFGFRTSNGRIKSSARKSSLFTQHNASSQRTSVAKKDSKRNTAIPIGSGSANNTTSQALPAGLGLDIFGNGGSSGPSLEPHDCSPLGRLSDAGDRPPIPERSMLRVVDGKAKRPVSTEVDEVLKVGASRKGRTVSGWGSWRKAIGRDRVASGAGKSYWEGKDDDGGKVFI